MIANLRQLIKGVGHEREYVVQYPVGLPKQQASAAIDRVLAAEYFLG